MQVELHGTKDEPLGTKDEPLGTKDEPLGTKDEPLGTKDEPLGTKDEPLGTKNELLRPIGGLCDMQGAPAGGCPRRGHLHISVPSMLAMSRRQRSGRAMEVRTRLPRRSRHLALSVRPSNRMSEQVCW
jgi:hypothetical protein